jgi:hypothetical protein
MEGVQAIPSVVSGPAGRHKAAMRAAIALTGGMQARKVVSYL